MPDVVPIDLFRELLTSHPLFDVRTPSEYLRGRIPSASNLPLFEDDERAQVGTSYKQVGRREAIKLGLDLVGPKMRGLLEQVEGVVSPPDPVLLHCWRGGMRSASVGWLLELYGYDVTVLEGGYKRYRRWVLDTIAREFGALLVVGGLTGSGKTRVLHELAARGEQIIDLEGLAGHRGSAFGGIEQDPRGQQDFENQMAEVVDGLDLSRRVWVEDESRLVGRCAIPVPLWEQKQRAPLFFYERARESRVERLVEDYGRFPRQALRVGFEKIRKRLGGRRTELALDALDAGDLRPACREALNYYDKAYRHHIGCRDSKRVDVDVSPEASLARVAEAMIDAADGLQGG